MVRNSDQTHGSLFPMLFLLLSVSITLKIKNKLHIECHVLTLKIFLLKIVHSLSFTIGMFGLFLFKHAIFGAKCGLNTYIMVCMSTFVFRCLYSSCSVIFFFTPVYTSNKSCQFLVCFRLVTFYLWHEIDCYAFFFIFRRHSYESLQHSFISLFLEGQCMRIWSQETSKVWIHKSLFSSVWKLRWHRNDSKPWQCVLKHKP